MIISELLGVKKFKDLDEVGVLDKMRELFKNSKTEMKILGVGTFGVAFASKDAVYKFWGVDKSYEAFIQYCRKNKNNPFLPKFYSEVKSLPMFFKTFPKVKEDNVRLKYVKMEKLKKLDGRASLPFCDANSRLFKLLGLSERQNYVDLETISDIVADIVADIENIGQEEICEILCRSIYYHFPNNAEQMMFECYGDINEDLILFIETCEEIFKSVFGYPDLHQDNFGLRGDQIVILDPMYNNPDRSYNEMYNSLSDYFFEPTDAEKDE